MRRLVPRIHFNHEDYKGHEDVELDGTFVNIVVNCPPSTL